VLHVPLVIRASGIVPAGLRVATPVSLVDVTPTMLALAGVESQVPMQGADLVELLSLTERQASRPEDRTVYVETMRATKVEPIARTRTAKWISSPNGIQRFDMIADPEENSPQSDASVIAAGERLFEAYRRDNDETRRILGDPTAAPQPIDPLTEEKLRALGYSD
jgi:arylsulfatase A-like enzyme